MGNQTHTRLKLKWQKPEIKKTVKPNGSNSEVADLEQMLKELS